MNSRPLYQVMCLAVLFTLAFAVYFVGSDRPLRDAEAKYAEIPKEMVLSGDWLTPHLDFTPYYIKPPLTTWVTAGLYEIFGINERTARLGNMFWAFLGALLTGILAWRMFGAPYAPIASAIFLLTAEVYNYCLDAGIEFGLVTCTILALIFFWEFYQKNSLLQLCLFYIAMGLGFMAKGLPCVVFAGGAALLFLLFRKEGRKALRLFHPLPIALFLLITGPWVVLMLKIHPEFFRIFFINEHFERFLGHMDSNDCLFPTSIWLALVTGEFFPWVFFLPQLAAYLYKSVRSKRVPADSVLFLLIWSALPLLLFSLSKSKGDQYGLNCYPPLMILLALPFRDLLDRAKHLSPRAWGIPWFGIAPLSLIAAGYFYFGRDLNLFSDFQVVSLNLAVVFLVALSFCSLWIGLGFYTNRTRLAFAGIAVMMVIFFNTMRISYEIDFPKDSMKFAADTFNRTAKPGAALVCSEHVEFEHVAVLTYYTGKPVYMLKKRKGSILHFIQQARDAMCPNEAGLLRMVADRPAVYLVGKTQSTEARLIRLKLSFRPIAASGGRTLFRIAGKAGAKPARLESASAAHH